LNDRETMMAEQRTPYQPGLSVALTAWPDDHAPARYAVQARVGEGTLPLTLSLYLDGDLVDTEMGASPVHDFVASDVPPGRHVVTVRAVDGAGRWGGASAVLTPRAVVAPLTR
jgi:hypothetical protein